MAVTHALKIGVPVLALAALLGGFIPLGLHFWRAHQRAVAVEQARAEVCRRVGLARRAGSAYVSLPYSLLHNERKAKLGQSLFTDRRLASTRWRMCCICHAPEKNGSDMKVHAGLLTRPFQNAVLGTALLHDGRATNLTEAIRVMIEDGRFCAGGALSNVTTRLAKDAGMAQVFRACYEDGLTETNVLDAIDQFARTQLSSGCAFDEWVDGRADAFNETQRAGLGVFEAHKCVDCHDGPALGALKTYEGKRVIGLRGLPRRTLYLSGGSCSDLGAVLAMMPGGEMTDDERVSLLAFLKTL